MTAADAYAIQRTNTEHRLREEGRRVVGCKIGLTAKAVQAQLGVDQPDFGMLFDDMSFGDAEPIPMRRAAPAEDRGGDRLRSRARPGHGQPRARRRHQGVDHVLPALEIVGSRIAGWNIRFVDTVADNASSGAYVLGSTPRRLPDVDLRLCGMVMTRRGEPVSVGAGAACLGNPLNAVVWLARTMAAVGQPLARGRPGAVRRAWPDGAVNAGDVFETRINGLGSVKAVFETDLTGRQRT